MFSKHVSQWLCFKLKGYVLWNLNEVFRIQCLWYVYSSDLKLSRKFWVVTTQVTENDVDNQRDNLFHTWCLVKGTACSLVIDSGSCTKVVSTMLIKRLQIPTQDHPKPYKFQWLNDSGTMKVVSQALI